jgi:hypothetical protein
MTLEEIVNNLKSAGQDYGQLFNNNPRMDSFASVLQKGVGQLIPSNADFKSPEAMRDWGTAAALNAPMGLTFTGPKSMGWNHDAANTATKLLDNGADPAQVWKDHLIGRMPDKSLFSEISDAPLTVRHENFTDPYGSWGIAPQKIYGLNDIKSLMDEGISDHGIHSITGWAKHYGESMPAEGQWTQPPNSYYKENLIEHKPLSEQYDFNNLQTRGAASESPMANGYFSGENNKIVINAETNKKGFLQNYTGARSVAGHELQHAIQEKEGWARGGNLGMFEKERDAIYEKIKELNKGMDFHIKYAEEAKARGDLGMEKKFKALYQDRLNERNALSPYAQQDPYENYRRLTGEAQARATQDRMNMGMQQRRDTYPLAGGKLSDIPLDQLINRYR